MSAKRSLGVQGKEQVRVTRGDIPRSSGTQLDCEEVLLLGAGEIPVGVEQHAGERGVRLAELGVQRERFRRGLPGAPVFVPAGVTFGRTGADDQQRRGDARYRERVAGIERNGLLEEVDGLPRAGPPSTSPRRSGP